MVHACTEHCCVIRLLQVAEGQVDGDDSGGPSHHRVRNHCIYLLANVPLLRHYNGLE
jgi:hypothetical protein